jgi:hypothetical protein
MNRSVRTAAAVLGAGVLATPLAAGAMLATGAVDASAARVHAETLRYYQVAGPTRFYNAGWKAINVNPPQTLPKAGDSFDVLDTDYAGSFSHHAKRWTMTDHLTCTFSSADNAVCDGQFASGGSLLLVNHVAIVPSENTFHVPISEGTGAFAGAHGTVTIANLPNGNSNVVIKVR